jgi:hypothetical protein
MILKCSPGVKFVPVDSRSQVARYVVTTKERSLSEALANPLLKGVVRNLIGWVARTFFGDELFSDLFSLARSKSVSEFVEFTDRRNRVARAWYNEVRSISTTTSPSSSIY